MEIRSQPQRTQPTQNEPPRRKKGSSLDPRNLPLLLVGIQSLSKTKRLKKRANQENGPKQGKWWRSYPSIDTSFYSTAAGSQPKGTDTSSRKSCRYSPSYQRPYHQPAHLTLERLLERLLKRQSAQEHRLQQQGQQHSDPLTQIGQHSASCSGKLKDFAWSPTAADHPDSPTRQVLHHNLIKLPSSRIFVNVNYTRRTSPSRLKPPLTIRGDLKAPPPGEHLQDSRRRDQAQVG